MKRGNGTCIAHCKDSVGRTGVFIGLMNLMSEIDEGKGEVDVFETVFKMRAERMLMVNKELLQRGPSDQIQVLGWDDFDFACSAFCIVLLGLTGNWQQWLRCEKHGGMS